jgi:hypothetical protein
MDLENNQQLFNDDNNHMSLNNNESAETSSTPLTDKVKKIYFYS